MKSEGDVRRWLKKVAGDRVFWIEQGAGGTVGFPDAVVVVNPRGAREPQRNELAPVELKFGEIVDGLWLKPELRPAQHACARTMIKCGVKSFVLVGSVDGFVGIASMVVALQAIGSGVDLPLTEVDCFYDLEDFMTRWMA